MSLFLEIKGLKKLLEIEDVAGGHSKAKHTDDYGGPVAKPLQSGANTALFTRGCSACRAGCGGSPPRQRREKTQTLSKAQENSSVRLRGGEGPAGVSVVGQMFNFMPFFPTLEVITVRKRGAQNPSTAQQSFKLKFQSEVYP